MLRRCRPLRPGISGRALLAIGRAFTAVLIVLAACYAPLIERFGSLFQYFQSTLAYLVPPVVAVYLGGMFVPRFAHRAGLAGLAGGLAAGLALFLAQEVTGAWAAWGLPAVHFTYMAIAVLVLTLGVMALASVGRPGTDGDACFGRADLAPAAGRAGGWRDHRLQALALGLLLLAVIAAAW